MDDDLKLNHVPQPRPRGNTVRFLVLAVAIAAGLHLLVFGVLALSAHKNQPATKPTVAATSPTPSAPAIATPATVDAPATSTASAAIPPELRPAPTVAPTPTAKHARPARPAPPPRGRATTARHGHPVSTAKAATAHRRPASGKTKAAKTKAVKVAPRHASAHARAKPAGALDLDALSKFKSSGK